MKRPRILPVAVGAAVFALTACMPSTPDDPPGCEINGSTGQCAWGLNYQERAGQPMVWVRYQRQGESFFRETQHQNCRDLAVDGICRVYVYSGTGYLSITAQSGAS